MMETYQSWHYSLMPKIEFGYLLDRIGKLGTESAVKVYMGRLRQVYKGLLEFSSFEEVGDIPKVEEKDKVIKEEEKNEMPASVPVQNEEDIDLENAIQANEEFGEVDLDNDDYLMQYDEYSHTKDDLKRKYPEDDDKSQKTGPKYKQS